MARTSRKFQQIYWADFRRDTDELTADARAFYLLLIGFFFDGRDGTLPNDDDYIADLLRIKKRRWIAIRRELEQDPAINLIICGPKSNRLSQKRVLEDVAVLQRTSDAKASAGRVGGLKKRENLEAGARNLLKQDDNIVVKQSGKQKSSSRARDNENDKDIEFPFDKKSNGRLGAEFDFQEPEREPWDEPPDAYSDIDSGEEFAKARSGAPPVESNPDPQKAYFDFGKTVLGKSSGGQLKKLLIRFDGVTTAAHGCLMTASGKSSPAEYIAAVILNRDDDDDIERVL